MSVFFILPPDQLTALARLNRLWLTSCFMRLSQGPLQEKNTVLFMLDEAGSALEKLPALEQAVTLLRGYGVRISLYLQSLGQMTRLFPGDKGSQTVQANMTQMFFGVRDLETAREVSAWIGQTTVHSSSYQKSRSTTKPSWQALLSGQSSGANSTVSNTEGVTQTECARALIQPEEVLRLPENIALVLTKGIDPFACRVIKYYSDPALSEALAEQNSRVPAVAIHRQDLLEGPKKLLLNCPNCETALSSLAIKAGETNRCPDCNVKLTLRQRPRRNGRQRQ